MATTRRRQKSLDNNQLKKATATAMATATATATGTATAAAKAMVTAGGGSGGGGNDDTTTTAATAGNNDGDMDDGRGRPGGWDEKRGKGMICDFQFLLPMDEVGYFGVICVGGKV